MGANPARGAIVKLKRSADGTEPYSRISDLDGRFELRGATPGKYKVCASLTGSNPSDDQEISVAEGSDHEIEILIKSTAPYHNRLHKPAWCREPLRSQTEPPRHSEHCVHTGRFREVQEDDRR